MDSTFQHLVFGTFLHDIGKVMQRAEVPLSENAKNLMASGGPSRDGQSSHYHVAWTEDFFNESVRDIGLSEVDYEVSGKELAFKHHNPSNPYQWIVTEADHLSSGMERTEEKRYERDIHKRARLVPLRSLLTKKGEPGKPFPVCPLIALTSRDQSTYPEVPDKENSQVSQYKKLWELFRDDWRLRRATGFIASLAYLDALFERYFWSVPASTIDQIPDSSLYEHSRAATAIASCLYLFHKHNDSFTTSAVKDRETSKFLLVRGDLSGIQNYIFAISHAGSGKVAKKLRARSFLLGRILHLIALRILHSAGLTFFNLLMNAGGNFHILLPNTPGIRDLLIRIEQQAQQWLRQSFQGLISLNLAAVEMHGNDFVNRRIQDRFAELAKALSLRKMTPQKSLLQNHDKWKEEAFILSEAMLQSEQPSGYYDIESHFNEEDIGRDLTQAEFLAIYSNPRAGQYEILDWSFSLDHSFNRLPPGAHCLISFNRDAELTYGDPTAPVHYEYRARHVPIYKPGEVEALDAYVENHPEDDVRGDMILPFSAIAQTAEGYKSIAYLKADVDRLGLLFRHGLDWHPRGWTLSKIATFSRSLEFFFSGRVHNILNEKKFSMIYTVYSGGDDVLLVGPWSTIHQFARRLQEEWKEFNCNNPNLTLSTGITLSRPMTPVWFAAKEAEEALSKAKSIPTEDPKNQLCSFSHLIKWDEFDGIFEEINQVDKWIKSGVLSTSFVRNLELFSRWGREYQQKRKIEGLRYLPLLSYSLSRNIKNQEVVQWAEKFKQVDDRPIHHLGYVATYALYLNRR